MFSIRLAPIIVIDLVAVIVVAKSLSGSCRGVAEQLVGLCGTVFVVLLDLLCTVLVGRVLAITVLRIFVTVFGVILIVVHLSSTPFGISIPE